MVDVDEVDQESDRGDGHVLVEQQEQQKGMIRVMELSPKVEGDLASHTCQAASVSYT